MMIIKHLHKDTKSGEMVKCTYIDFKNYRVLIAFCETYWEGKFDLSREGLFINKLAIKIGKNKPK